MRYAIKRAVEVVGGAVAAPVLRRVRRDRIAILSYHNVVPDDEAGRGDASLHMPLSRFIEQVDRLRLTHDVVPLDAVEPAGRRPRAVITFDDAYRGTVELALPELARRGLPCTVFVAPGLLGEGTFWWDELGEAGLLSDETRERALRTLHGRAVAVRESLLVGRRPELPESFRAATPDELLGRAGPGVTFGSHTWSHAHLPSLDREERTGELERALAWTRSTAGGLGWLALPYGRGSAEVARDAIELGHAGVLEIVGGLWDPSSGTDSVPRINVPAGLSARGLELRTSGVRS